MNSVRGSDAVFRYGGEEFVVMLTDTDHAGAQVLAERLRADIEAHTMMFDMQAVTITASLGVSWLTPFDSVESLIKRADVAMYQAKRNGRNRVCFA
jgi:diguanylate cyclase (GGDEF)-like protein